LETILSKRVLFIFFLSFLLPRWELSHTIHSNSNQKIKRLSWQFLTGHDNPFDLDVWEKLEAGFHLHDANGYTDHEVPGKGEVDFCQIRKYLRDESVKN